MSTLSEEIQSIKTASQAQTAASQALAAEVAGKMVQIDAKVNAAINKMENQVGTAAKATLTTSKEDSTIGRVLKVGDFGLGSNIPAKNITDLNELNLLQTTGMYGAAGTVFGNPESIADGGCLSLAGFHDFKQIAWHGDSNLFFRGNDSLRYEEDFASHWTPWYQILHSGGTTIDSNGFIKKASPIIDLYTDKLELKESFKEIENTTLNKLSTGKYLLENCPALASKGWYLEQPKDRNGNYYHNIEWQYDEAAQTLLIETFEPAWNKDTGKYENGQPIDIQKGRFIALRFEENPSLYPRPEIEEEPELE